MWVGIDWCAFSLNVGDLFAVTGHDETDVDLVNELMIPERAQAAAVIAWHFFFQDSALTLDETPGKGKFYKHRFKLKNAADEMCGLIEVGGEYTRRKDGAVTMRIELTGEGCTAYEGRDLAAGSAHAQRWVLLKAKLESCDGRLARLDVAADDFTGQHSVASAIEMWKGGKFDNRGQRPKAQHIDDMGSNAGCTFNIGSRTSEKMLRVYEKDKQLGDVGGLRVRWEVEFHASTRKPLDLDSLRDPESFFRGAYPVLAFIEASMARFESVGASRDACMKSLFRHVRRQYGKSFNFLAHYFKDDADIGAFVVMLSRPGLPAWAHEYLGTDTGDNVQAFANI